MKRPQILGILAALMMIIIFTAVLYQDAQSEHWQDRKSAIQTAFEHTSMVKSGNVGVFNGEQSYTIVEGVDQDNNPLIVWISGEEIHSIYAAEGISRGQLLANMENGDSAKHIVRIVPGKWRDTYAWEVYYKKPENSTMRYYYDYYDFLNGTLLETYRMSK